MCVFACTRRRGAFFYTVDRYGHMPVGSVLAYRWVPGSLGCLRRTWRADASDRAGDVCSRKPLAFDEGRRGRGWRVRAVASPHRITAAISSCLSFRPPFSFLFSVTEKRICGELDFFDDRIGWMKDPTLRVRGVRIVPCDSPVRAICSCFFLSREAMRPPMRC